MAQDTYLKLLGDRERLYTMLRQITDTAASVERVPVEEINRARAVLASVGPLTGKEHFTRPKGGELPVAPKLIGKGKIEDGTLELMRERGGTWAAYQDHDFPSHNLGHLRFLKYGQGCTFSLPPNRFPDTPEVIGWRYLYVGKVNLETGKIEEEKDR